MREIQASEAKAKLASLLGDVERGESVTITRHGKPIARLVPAGTDDAQQRLASVAALRRWRGTLDKTGLTTDDLLAARDEGRR